MGNCWNKGFPSGQWLRSLAVLVGLNLNCLSQTLFSPCSPLVRSWGKFKSFSPRRGLPLLLVALLLPTVLIRAFLQCGSMRKPRFADISLRTSSCHLVSNRNLPPCRKNRFCKNAFFAQNSKSTRGRKNSIRRGRIRKEGLVHVNQN